MTDRLVGEILFDPEHAKQYIGLEVVAEEGVMKGSIVASGEDAESVHVALRQARNNKPEGLFYFYRPLENHYSKDRQGWVLGGEV